MEPYQQRVMDEKTELDRKIKLLLDFIEAKESKTIFEVLPFDEQERMNRQYNLMRQYSEVLGERIDAFGIIH